MQGCIGIGMQAAIGHSGSMPWASHGRHTGACIVHVGGWVLAHVLLLTRMHTYYACTRTMHAHVLLLTRPGRMQGLCSSVTEFAECNRHYREASLQPFLLNRLVLEPCIWFNEACVSAMRHAPCAMRSLCALSPRALPRASYWRSVRHVRHHGWRSVPTPAHSRAHA